MKTASSGWLNKVPEVTLSFWIIKIMSTTVGETFADFLAVDVGWGLAITSAVMAVLLAGTLTLQMRKRNCEPWIYWLCVVLVSILGTQITDISSMVRCMTVNRRSPSSVRQTLRGMR